MGEGPSIGFLVEIATALARPEATSGNGHAEDALKPLPEGEICSSLNVTMFSQRFF